MAKVFLIVLILVGIAFLGLGINIFFRKLAFPQTEVGKNKNMKALGLTCARCDEMRKFREKKKFTQLSLDVSKLDINERKR